MTRKIIILAIISVLAFSGCNIFGWLYPGGSTSGDTTELKLEGDIALQKGDLDTALDYYAKAVSADPKNSAARWGYVKTYILKNNVQLIMLASKFTGDQDPADIITAYASTLNTMMNEIINYAAPIVEGPSDGVISQYDINVNGTLMLAYFIRGFIGNADSNHDGNYFSALGPGGGDVMIFDNNGQFTYNANVVNIDSLQNSLESMYNDLSTSVSDPSNNRLSRSVVSNIIVITHDLTEDLLYVYKIFGGSFNDFSKAVSALNNIAQGLPDTEVFTSFKSDIDARYQEMSSYLNGAEIDTSVLNYDHFMMVGYNMSGYSGGTPSKTYEWTDYANFNKTAFTNHTPIATTYEPGKTNYLMRLNNHSGDYLTNAIANYAQFTNDLNFLNELYNSVQDVFNDIANANMIKNLTGGL